MVQEIGPEHEAAFLAMVEDYRKNDRRSLVELFGDDEWTPAKFKKLVKDADKLKADWRPKAGKLSITRYVWLSQDGAVRALGLMRFPLDDKLENDGGNLFVSVPPSLRKQGFGSYCLALLLFEAVRAGLRRVLVTCVSADEGARKVIEKNRGVLQDEAASKNPDRKGEKIARYWISFS